jgi:hypothetical protein
MLKCRQCSDFVDILTVGNVEVDIKTWHHFSPDVVFQSLLAQKIVVQRTKNECFLGRLNFFGFRLSIFFAVNVNQFSFSHAQKT